MELDQIINRFNLDPTSEDWQAIQCPFDDHPDNSKSAGIKLGTTVYDSMFNCFGCNRSFNVTNLPVTEDSWLEEAMDDLLGEALYLPKKQSKKVSTIKQIDEVSTFFTDRCISQETLDKFTLIYHSKPKEDFYGYLEFKISGMSVYRKMLDNIEGERYRNPKNAARKLIVNNMESANIILVEGITDLLAVTEAGFDNVVCSLGSKLSREQAYLLRGKTVFILYDKDFAGYDGAQKASVTLREYKATPVTLEIPDWLYPKGGKGDPGECLRFDKDAFRIWLHEATSKYDVFNTSAVSKFFDGSNNLKVYRTGITDYDNAMAGGIVRGVHAWTGLPASGKSTLVVEMTDSFIQQGARVLLLTYELATNQYWSRLASRYSKHSWTEIERSPEIVEPEVKARMLEYSKSLRIDSDSTLDEVIVSSRNFDILVVDYIQRMPYFGPDERTGIKQNVKGLSNLTRSHDKVVVLLSSMPRSQYNQDGAGAFKETGDIEYVVQSGVIIKKDGDVISGRMMKNTRGPLATFFARCDWPHQRLTNHMDIMEVITDDPFAIEEV